MGELSAGLWHDSPMILRQIKGIGISFANTLLNNNIKHFDDINDARTIEILLGRNPPFGNNILKAIDNVPKFYISQLNHKTNDNSPLGISLIFGLKNSNPVKIFNIHLMIVAFDDQNVPELLIHRKKLNFKEECQIPSPSFLNRIKGKNIEIKYRVFVFSETFAGVNKSLEFSISTNNCFPNGNKTKVIGKTRKDDIDNKREKRKCFESELIPLEKFEQKDTIDTISFSSKLKEFNGKNAFESDEITENKTIEDSNFENIIKKRKRATNSIFMTDKTLKKEDYQNVKIKSKVIFPFTGKGKDCFNDSFHDDYMNQICNESNERKNVTKKEQLELFSLNEGADLVSFSSSSITSLLPKPSGKKVCKIICRHTCKHKDKYELFSFL